MVALRSPFRTLGRPSTYQAGASADADDIAKLRSAVDAILTGYAKGTRYRIHMDADGLIAAGEPGVQLTWMDAKVGNWVVTPRIGKPVEIQALWINALRIGSAFDEKWKCVYDHALASFQCRFWNEDGGYLYDVIDCDHRDGAMDGTLRPNQIFAVGGVPLVARRPTSCPSLRSRRCNWPSPSTTPR